MEKKSDWSKTFCFCCRMSSFLGSTVYSVVSRMFCNADSQELQKRLFHTIS